MIHTTMGRRPIRSRHTAFAQQTTKWLANLGFRPNHLSLLSIVFSLLAAISIAYSPYFNYRSHFISLIIACGFIVLRLLCNLFDGMLAIEEGFVSKTGEIYNDFPDRPSDVLILVGSGCAIGNAYGLTLAWISAILAVLTAYVRLLGNVSGAKTYFIGPMAKQHRMAVMIVTCLLSAMFSTYATWIFTSSLIIIAIGSLLTIIRRLKYIALDLGQSQNLR